jgi:hypothetical protein
MASLLAGVGYQQYGLFCRFEIWIKAARDAGRWSKKAVSSGPNNQPMAGRRECLDFPGPEQ